MGPICILTSFYLDQKGKEVFKWGMIMAGDRHTWSGVMALVLLLWNPVVLSPEKGRKV